MIAYICLGFSLLNFLVTIYLTRLISLTYSFIVEQSCDTHRELSSVSSYTKSLHSLLKEYVGKVTNTYTGYYDISI